MCMYQALLRYAQIKFHSPILSSVWVKIYYTLEQNHPLYVGSADTVERVHLSSSSWLRHRSFVRSMLLSHILPMTLSQSVGIFRGVRFVLSHLRASAAEAKQQTIIWHRPARVFKDFVFGLCFIN